MLLFALSILSAFTLGVPGAPQTDAENTPVSTPTGASDGNITFISDTPLVCVDGCYYAFNSLIDCYSHQTAEGCASACTGANYSAIVACLECSIANGEQDTDIADSTKTLEEVNAICQAANVSGFQASTTITATPTSTGPFTTTVTGDLITALPTWTGLTSYLDQITPDTGSSSQTPTLGSGEGYGYAKPTNILGTIHISSASSSASSSAAASSSSSAALRSNVPSSFLWGAVFGLLALVMA